MSPRYKEFLRYLNIPYRKGGRNFSGCDCLGLVQLFYQGEYGVELPAFTEYEASGEISPLADPAHLAAAWGFEKTSEVFTGYVALLVDEHRQKHLGIMLGSEYYLHTSLNGTAISNSWLFRPKAFYRHTKAIYL